MPCEPVRFLHACGLRLDSPLEDRGGLPEGMTHVAEDATFVALDNLVAACIDGNVDFLLLTGDIFAADEVTLRACVALRSALEQLDEYGVPVFICPDDGGTPGAWGPAADLPESVTVLQDGDEPTDVSRDGAVVASVSRLTADQALRTSDQGDSPDRPAAVVAMAAREASALLRASLDGPRDGEAVAAVAAAACGDQVDGEVQESDAESVRPCFDYIAAGGDVRRTVTAPFGVIHWPGAAQGLSARDTGANGATLVEVDESGGVTRTFVPLAPVRRERFLVHVNEKTIRDELLAEMRFVLDRSTPEPCETVWLVTWAIHGGGPFFETLFDAEEQGRLVGELDWQSAGCQEVHVEHRLRLYREAAEEGAAASDLQKEFANLLEGLLAETPHLLDELLRGATSDDPSASASIVELLPKLDGAAVAGSARGLGRRWFDECAQ